VPKTKFIHSISEATKLSIRIIKETVRSYDEHDCALRAAGLAYHVLLSLFPLLLFLVYSGSYVLSSQAISESLSTYLQTTLPSVAPMVERVLEQTITARSSLGVLGALLLLWSASVVFSSLSTTLNVIWGALARPFWRQRLLAIVTVLAIGLLFISSNWLSAITVWPWTISSPITRWGLSPLIEPTFTILFFWVIFRMLPNRKIHAGASLVGAVLGGILWKAAKSGFTWFLSSGLSNYGFVYGSLASVVSLMLWIYLSGAILFLGAEFGSTLERTIQERSGKT
jgi:membrane protein